MLDDVMFLAVYFFGLGTEVGTLDMEMYFQMLAVGEVVQLNQLDVTKKSDQSWNRDMMSWLSETLFCILYRYPDSLHPFQKG